MRLLLALGTLIVCAGCVPDFTRIKCATDENCPSSQTCGVNAVCVDHCSLPCGNTGRVCSFHTGVPACECPQNTGDTFHVRFGADAGGSLASGVTTPPECAFPRLDSALAAAQSYVQGHPDAGARVLAPAGTVPLANFPLTLPASVLLDVETPGPGQVLVFEDSRAAPGVLWSLNLEGGATLANARILRSENSEPAYSTSAIAAHCGSGSVVHVRGVTVGGDAGNFSVGITANAGCTVDASDLRIVNTLGGAFRSESGARIEVDGGVLLGNATVGTLVGGGLALAFVTIEGPQGISLANTGEVSIRSSSFQFASPAEPSNQLYLVNQQLGDAGAAGAQVLITDTRVVDAGVVRLHDAHAVLTGVTASGAPGDCVMVNSTVLWVDGGSFTGCGQDGIHVLPGSRVTLDHVLVSGSVRHGINAAGSFITVLGGEVQASGQDGFSLATDGGAVLTGTLVHGNGGAQVHATATAVTLDATRILTEKNSQTGVTLESSAGTLTDVTVDGPGVGIFLQDEVGRATTLSNVKATGVIAGGQPLLFMTRAVLQGNTPNLTFRDCDFNGGNGVVLGDGSGSFNVLAERTTFRGGNKNSLAVVLTPTARLNLDTCLIHHGIHNGMSLTGFRLPPVSGSAQPATVQLTRNRFFGSGDNQLLIDLDDTDFSLENGTGSCLTGNHFYCYSASPGVSVTSRSLTTKVLGTRYETFVNAPITSADLQTFWNASYEVSVCGPETPAPTCAH